MVRACVRSNRAMTNLLEQAISTDDGDRAAQIVQEAGSAWRVGRGISPPTSRRTERETLASLGSHQANVPVIPSRQCTNRPAFSCDNFCRKRLARILCALKRLNFRIAQARSI